MLPKVAAVLKVRVMEAGELALPMFTDPKFVPVSGLTDWTVKLSVTMGAAAYTTPSPGWLAWMVQVPADTSVAVEAELETVQMAGVVDVKLTGNPELAVAVNVTGTDKLIACAEMAAKLIVWAVRLIVKLCVTMGAAA